MTCCNATMAYPSPELENEVRHVEEQHLRASSVRLDDGMLQTSFTVPDMVCVGCITKIEREISALPFVETVRANLSLKRVTVTWNGETGSARLIDNALTALGFDHMVFDVDQIGSTVTDKKGKQFLIAMAVAGFAMANIMLLSVSVWSGANAETAQLFHLISGLIAVPAVAIAGQPFFKSAWSALKVKRLNMDVPISLAVLLSLFMSLYESSIGGKEAYFDAAVMLLFFLLIGRYLDHLMRQKARSAVERLAQMSSKGAMLVDEKGETAFIPTSEIERGMKLRIKPGERFPVDCEILSGVSDIDRSLVTGESDSITVKAGETIEAGALNLTGLVEIYAISTAQNSFLAEMQNMMEVAENGRGQYVHVADRMAQIYAPAVHLLAFMTFVIWMVFTGGDLHASIYTAIAVLIITCPCALGLAVPVAHVIGANRLMKKGILLRDGSALERMSELDTVVFDKTGTLTTSTPIVTTAQNITSSLEPLCKAMAAGSSHPYAKAVLAFMPDVKPAKLEDVKELPGLGVEARFGGKTLRFGKLEWASKHAKTKKTDNSSVAFSVDYGEPVVFELQDTMRPMAKEVVQSFLDDTINVKILSGDKAFPVETVAKSLNVTDFAHSLTPAEKINELNALKEQGHKVLMVGDGLNDAPALTSANVSMAPSDASDIGRLASDFIFINPSLKAVKNAYDTAKTVNRIVRQNFGIALAYNCIAVPLAMMGFITPLIAALAMSGSSIVVIANSMRINFAVKQEAEQGIEQEFQEKIA